MQNFGVKQSLLLGIRNYRIGRGFQSLSTRYEQFNMPVCVFLFVCLFVFNDNSSTHIHTMTSCGWQDGDNHADQFRKFIDCQVWVVNISPALTLVKTKRNAK